ncbi:MAG: phage minor head protein [Myxococcota bacterium]
MRASARLLEPEAPLIELGSCRACGSGPHNRRLRLVQPSGANGSPEAIIQRASVDCSEVTGQWAEQIVRALSGTTPASINHQVTTALGREHIEAFAEPTERALTHSIMLGAVDSAYEATTNDTITPPAFKLPASLASSRTLAQSVVPPALISGFAEMPYQSAVGAFLRLHPLPRRVFDVLSDKAKLRSFTIARMTSVAMIRTVQKELARQIARGANLREFRKFAAARLESAGWTPANASHVETIFRTNVLKAYTAGRVEHMMRPSVLKARPFWKVLTVNDGPPRQRRTHQNQHGKVLRADNPIWATKMVPWGFNCRCRVTSVPASYKGKIWDDLEGVPDPGFTGGIAHLIS